MIKSAVVMPAPVTNDEKCALPGPTSRSTTAGTSSMCRVSSCGRVGGKEGARPGGKAGARVLDVLGEAGGEEGGKVRGAGGVFGELLSSRRTIVFVVSTPNSNNALSWQRSVVGVGSWARAA